MYSLWWGLRYSASPTLPQWCRNHCPNTSSAHSRSQVCTDILWDKGVVGSSEYLMELENIGIVINLNLEIEQFSLEVTFPTYSESARFERTSGSPNILTGVVIFFSPYLKFQNSSFQCQRMSIKKAPISSLESKLGCTTDRYKPKQNSTKNCMDCYIRFHRNLPGFLWDDVFLLIDSSVHIMNGRTRPRKKR